MAYLEINAQLEIREAHEDELTTMLRVTKASYAEFRDGSPDAFWDIYMANIDEAILRAPDTERIAAPRWRACGERLALPKAT